jgi:hypothetical protein
MRKILILASFILLWSSISMDAQNFNLYYNKLIEDFNEYSDAEILPKYIELKEEFEKKITPADKKTLDSLRHEFKTTRSMIGSEHQIFMELRKSESKKKVSRGEIRRYLTDVRKHLNELGKESQFLIQKYNKQLDESLKSLSKYDAKWAAGMDTIISEWQKENKVELDDITIKYGTIRMDQYMKRINTLKHNIKTNISKEAFLLWDGRFDLIMDDVYDEEDAADKVALTIKPNPFLNNCLIECDIPLTEQVDVTVINGQAQVIAQLYKGKWEAGKHEVNFDITKADRAPLPPGAYYIKLSSPSYVITKMIISEK